MRDMRFSLFWSVPTALFFLFLSSRSFLSFLLNHLDSIGKETFFYLLQHCRDIVFVCALFTGFYSLGRRIFRIFGFLPEPLTQMEKFLYSSLLGEAAIGYLLLVLGLIGLFQKKSFAILYFFLLLGSLPEIKKIPALAVSFKNLLAQKCSLISFLLVLFLTIALLRGFIASGAPPVNWDSIAYHLAFPKLFLEQEKIFRIPWSINAHYPLHTEMIYTLALSLCSDLAAHWVNFVHGILFLLAVFTVAKRFFSDFSAKVAVALLAVQPVFQRVFGNAATDFPVALSCTMAFHSWLLGKQSQVQQFSLRFHILCGTLCGIAASYKLTGLWISFSFFLLTLFMLFRAGLPLQWKGLFYFTLAFGLLAFPWYLKNILWTGNPIWPYLGEWFGATPEELHTWNRIKASVTEGIEKNLFNWLSIPIHLMVTPKSFSYEPQYLAFPFLALLLARFFQKEKKGITEIQSLILLSIFATIWFWTYQDWRYFLPLTGLIAISISFWAEKLYQNNSLGKIVSIFLFFSFVPIQELSVNNELFVFFGLKSKFAPQLSARERYLEHVLGDSYRLMRISNQLLPENAKVLFFGEVRGYYFARAYAWGDPLNPGVFAYAKIKNTKELHKILLEQKFTHILTNPLIGNYKGDQTYYARCNQLMVEFLKNHTKLVANSGPVALFQISTKFIVP